jgi:type IV pilus assembly protein PilW
VGFTLVEVMVSMVITAFVLLGAVMAMRSQQHSYKAGQWTREAQDSVRRAALVLEQRVRHASLGVDPAFALDFAYYGIREPFRDASLCPPQMSGCPRDATQNSDELVFYVRDPAFRTQDPPVGHAWALTGVTLNTATLSWKPGDAFPAGQILLAICRDPNKYAFFTVSRTATNGALAGSPATSTTLQLEPVDANDPFRRQDVAAGNPPIIPVDACFSNGYAYKIDRYRFHVRPVAVDATRFEPYLVLDMGIDRNLDGAVDANDEILVARGIEVFQVSYQLSNGATVGETPGQAIAFADANGAVAPPVFGSGAADTITRSVFPLAAPAMERSIYFPSSWFPRSSADPVRLLNAQGNIRAVHVALVARSLGPDPDRGTNLIIGPGFNLLNFQGTNAAPGWLVAGRPTDGDDRFVRARLELTIPLPNMTSRALSL